MHSYCHRGGEEPLLGATIPEHFAQVVAAHAEREALVCLPQQRRLSYAELATAADRVAAGLAAIGFASALSRVRPEQPAHPRSCVE